MSTKMKMTIALCTSFSFAASSHAVDPASQAALGLAYDTGWSHDENSGDGYAYFSGTAFVD